MVKRKTSMLEAFNSAGGLTPLKPQETPTPIQKAAPKAEQASPVAPVPVSPAAQPAQPAPDGVLTPAPKQPAPQKHSAGGPFANGPSVSSEPALVQPVQSAQSGAFQTRPQVPLPAATSDAPLASQDKSLHAPSSALVWVLLGLIVMSFSAAAWYGKQDQGAQAASPGEESQDSTGSSQAILGGFAPSNSESGTGQSTQIPSDAGLGESNPAKQRDPLLDLANKYTVVVITYGKSHGDFASAAQEFLRDSGLPVNRILQVKNKLVICAGATATRAELNGLEDRIHKLSFNGQRGVYSDAYVDAISKYIDR